MINKEKLLVVLGVPAEHTGKTTLNHDDAPVHWVCNTWQPLQTGYIMALPERPLIKPEGFSLNTEYPDGCA